MTKALKIMRKFKLIEDFRTILEFVDYFDSEEKCQWYLAQMRWKDGEAICPHCDCEKVYHLKGKNKRYKCSDCRKQFSVKVGTIFESSPLPLKKWFFAIYFHVSGKKGISSMQLAKEIGVTQKTAWHMLHRIRHILSDQNDDQELYGEIEVDETYVGGKEKNKHKSKRVGQTQGRSTKVKAAVFGMIERGGKLIAKSVENVQRKTLHKEINDAVKEGSFVYSDEWKAYRGLINRYNHEIVVHSAYQYVDMDGEAHTNTLEGFWSLLKRGITGFYHSVSKKHIDRYVDEYVFRYNIRAYNVSVKFNYMLQHLEKRLSYKLLIKEP